MGTTIPKPEFTLGQNVRVKLNDRNRTPHAGPVREIIWHTRDQRYNYYLLDQGRKVSKRYVAEDLELVDAAHVERRSQ